MAYEIIPKYNPGSISSHIKNINQPGVKSRSRSGQPTKHPPRSPTKVQLSQHQEDVLLTHSNWDDPWYDRLQRSTNQNQK